MNLPQEPRAESAPPSPDLEPLVAECLARLEREGSGALEHLCRDHPEQAAALRSAVASLEGWGLGAQPPTEPTPARRRFGDFEIRREIGRGGMGVVYEAEQLSLRRTVALKVLPAHLTQRRAAIQRFQREALTAAHLKHPSIVEVLAVGMEADVHYFAMEFVEGTPLDRVIEQMKSSPAEGPKAAKAGAWIEALAHEPAKASAAAAKGASGSRPARGSAAWNRGYIETIVRLVARVADALDHAHRHGVIHRDVKPSNVIVREDGTPVLTDFGLAREEGLPSITETGEFAGTPYYVSPEQAMSRRVKVDHRTDVFSLGVTLYELLTLERPFQGETTQEVLARILTKEPPDPQKLNPRLASDLVTIVLKAIEKDPDRRYATAGAIADDLRAFLEYRPIAAKRATAASRVLRWSRRQPAKAALVGVLMACIPSLGLLAGYVIAKAPDVRAAAEQARREAVEQHLEDGFLQLGERSPALASKAFAAALAIDPESVEATAGSALVALRKPSRASEALEILGRRPATAASEPMLERIRVDALREAGREAEAAELETRIGPVRGAVALFLEGAREMRRGNRGGGKKSFERALALSTRAVATSPRARLLYHLQCALAAELAGDEAAAREAAESLGVLWPGSKPAWYMAGQVLSSFDSPASLAAYRRAIDLDPSFTRAHAGLGDLLFNSGDVEGALAAYRRVVELAPDRAEAHSNLAIAFRRSGDLAGAIAEHRRAIELDPKLFHSHIRLGDALRAAGDAAGAIAAFRGAIEVDPMSVPAHGSLGLTLMKNGDLAGAVAEFRRVLELDPDDINARAFLDQTLRKAGEHGGATTDRADARKALERATERRPADAIAWNALAWFLVDPEGDAAQWDPAAALKAARRAVELSGGETPAILDTLAEALFRTGDVAGAIATEEKALHVLERTPAPDETLRAALERSLARFRGAGAGVASGPATSPANATEGER